MSTGHRRDAALANQRAAAFVRLQLLGDHEAMHLLLTGLDDDTARLGFVTALASIAGTLGTLALGRDGTLDHLRRLAETSLALASTDDWPEA